MKIYINADSIVTPIGFGTQENLAALCSYRSGLTNHTTSDVSDTPIVMSEFHDHSIRLESKILDLESQSLGLIVDDGGDMFEHLGALAHTVVVQHLGGNRDG